MKAEQSNSNSILLKVFLIILLITSFALVSQKNNSFEKESVLNTELVSSHYNNTDALASSQPEIPSHNSNWIFGSNGEFMAHQNLILNKLYAQENLVKKQKYLLCLFLNYKEKLDNQYFTLSHSLSKESPVSYSA